MPRLPPQNCRPAHTRAVASLDGTRCGVTIDTGADISLVSDRALRPGVKYLPWSERDVCVTGVAQQGVTILGRVVLKVQLGLVRALTAFPVALGVGFDAILGVDFLYEHGISVNLAQHCLVFEAHDGLIVPLVGYHPRFKHAGALTHDVSLRPGARALVRCTYECLRGTTMHRGVPELHLTAALKDHRLGLVIPEQLSSGAIEIQSAADYPLHLPAGWAVAKVQDCQFAFYGPPRLARMPRRVVVNLVAAGDAGKFPRRRCDGSFGSAAACGGPDPKAAEGPSPGQGADSRSNTASQKGFSSAALGEMEARPTERARSPDREPRPPRPRSVSPYNQLVQLILQAHALSFPFYGGEEELSISAGLLGVFESG